METKDNNNTTDLISENSTPRKQLSKTNMNEKSLNLSKPQISLFTK